MRAVAHKVTARAVPSAKSPICKPRQGGIVEPAPDSQRTTESQAPQRRFSANAGTPSANSNNSKPGHLGHCFSRVRVHAKAPAKRREKLAVSNSRDASEQEADRVAEQVLADAADDKVMAAPPQLQRSTTQFTGNIDAAPAAVGEVLANPGMPLEPALRREMERRFGYDFSQVRVHCGPGAEESARDVRAKAYAAGNHIVFGAGKFAPSTYSGQRLLAHELAHVVQQTPPRGAPVPMLHRDGEEEKDPWDKLSPSGRDQAEELFEQCSNWIRFLAVAQQAHHSQLRGAWLNFLGRISARIAALDDDSKIAPVKNAFDDYTKVIGRNVSKFADEWTAVEKRYLDEHRYLLSAQVKSIDSTEAAKYIEQLYEQSKGWLHKGAEIYLTDEEYDQLKITLERGQHLWIGALRGARTRAKDLKEMMDAVADLRRNGEDPEKFVPGWNEQVTAEAAYLEKMANSANDAYQAETDPLRKENNRGYQVEFSGLRTQLLQKQQETLAVKPPPEKGVLEKGFDLVKGGVEAFTGVFVEAARQAWDLTQIGLHFASFGKYEPKFTSDMAAAAAQGATTGDLLKGMVTGLVETPSRFMKACEDGDWEAIGRETVNLYLLAKTLKEAPEQIKKLPDAVKRLPELLAKTRESLRILRARTVALAFKSEGRLLPEAFSKPVRGFRPPGDKPPAVTPPPAKSPPVRGFRPPDDTSPSPQTGPHPQTPSPKVRGFRPPGDTPATPPPPGADPHPPSKPVRGFQPPGKASPPSPPSTAEAPHTPSRRVGGFARKSEPAPAPPHQGPQVLTQMPPARGVPASPGGEGVAGERGGQPAKATAGKPPESGGGKPKPEPAKAGKVEPVKTEKPEPAQSGKTEPAKTAKAQGLKPLLTDEDLNKPVPQDKGVTGPKRRLTAEERANANKILKVLDRVRGGDQKALNDLAPFRPKPLKGDLQGWYEVDLLEENPGYANQMRLLVRIRKGDSIDVKLLQMHGGKYRQ